MLPKKIHYCWFGGKPLNRQGKKCIQSWKKFFPDYEIIEWNEHNFDINCCQYVQEAYNAKKWAFVSDYARFKILYEQGGIYLDTDVEVIRPFDFINNIESYMGCENSDLKSGIKVNPGVGFAVAPGNIFLQKILLDYEQSSFYNTDGTFNLITIVERTTKLLKKYGLKDTLEIQKVAGFTVFPCEYFCPINMETGKLECTKNTYSIHRYAGSWVSMQDKFRGKVYNIIYRIFGEKIALKARRIFGKKEKK